MGSTIWPSLSSLYPYQLILKLTRKLKLLDVETARAEADIDALAYRLHDSHGNQPPAGSGAN